MKFYTEDGNWDLVGNNTPIFFIRDPLLVSYKCHTHPSHTHTWTRMHTCMHAPMHSHVHIYTYTCAYTCMPHTTHAHAHAHTHTQHMHTHNTCTHIHIHMHTHAHTQHMHTQHMHMHMHTHTHTTHAHAYTCTHTQHMHMHTHAHTQHMHMHTHTHTTHAHAYTCMLHTHNMLAHTYSVKRGPYSKEGCMQRSFVCFVCPMFVWCPLTSSPQTHKIDFAALFHSSFPVSSTRRRGTHRLISRYSYQACWSSYRVAGIRHAGVAIGIRHAIEWQASGMLE